MAARTGSPRARRRASDHHPCSRCHSRDLAGLSAVPKPEELLELQHGEDMEIETGEAALGARGLLGQLWKDNPARVTTLFIGSLGKTYMVRKRTSSCHKTRLLCGSPKYHQTLKDSCQAREAPNNCMLAFFPKHPIGCGLRETVFYVTSGRAAPC